MFEEGVDFLYYGGVQWIEILPSPAE
jgi:hypothetical protein